MSDSPERLSPKIQVEYERTKTRGMGMAKDLKAFLEEKELENVFALMADKGVLNLDVGPGAEIVAWTEFEKKAQLVSQPLGNEVYEGIFGEVLRKLSDEPEVELIRGTTEKVLAAMRGTFWEPSLGMVTMFNYHFELVDQDRLRRVVSDSADLLVSGGLVMVSTYDAEKAPANLAAMDMKGLVKEGVEGLDLEYIDLRKRTHIGRDILLGIRQ